MSFTIDIPVTLYEQKVLSIDAEHLSFHDLEMEIKEITGFSYGRVITTSAGLSTGGNHYYQFADSSGDIISFGFMDSVLLNSKKNAGIGQAIEEAIWQYIGNPLLNRMVRDIHDGHDVPIGDVKVNREGIHGRNEDDMRRPKFVIPWEYAIGSAQNGSLLISSAIRGTDACSIPLRTILNAHVLHRILFYMQSNVYLRDVLRGIHPPLA